MEPRYTCQQVADLYHVKIITIWDWIRTKKLPAVKIGKQYVVRQSDLEQFETSRLTTSRQPET